MTPPTTENRQLPRYREVSEADRAKGLRVAARAKKLTVEMATLRARTSSLSRQRDVLLHDANQLGISRYELAKITGKQRKVIDDALTRYRDGQGASGPPRRHRWRAIRGRR